MSQKTVTNREIQQAIPALNCLLEGDGAFGFLDDLLQYRVARLAQELDVQSRRIEAARGPALRKYYKTKKVPTGVGEDGPQFEDRLFIPADDRWSHDEAANKILDEQVTIDVPEILASQLRQPGEGEGSGKIPTGWFTVPGESEPRKLGPAALLMALGPFLVMDLGD